MFNMSGNEENEYQYQSEHEENEYQSEHENTSGKLQLYYNNCFFTYDLVYFFF
jgi:hypothetical protein